MSLSLKAKLWKNNFRQNFIQQPDNYSCGPAAMTTVARLYDLPEEKDFLFFKKVANTYMKSMENCGTLWVDLSKSCREHLPVQSMGRNTYHGGIALANTRHKPEGDNHFVVYLAREKDEQIYFDPFEGKIFHDNIRNMARVDDYYYKDWTLNFADIKGANFGFWGAHAEENPYCLHDQHFWMLEHGKKLKL